MPASRPQHPDRHTKTKTAAPSTTTTSTPVSSTEQTQSQHQHAIVSSPLSSPTNPHQFNRFSGPPPSLSLARSQQPQSKGNSHATDTSIKSLSETEHPIVPVLPSSESVSSTSSSHSFSNNRNITSNGRVLNPSQAHEQKAQLQAQSESQTQMIALAEARLFAQQLHQQQQQQQLLLDQQNSNQFSKHLDASRRASLMGAGPRSVVGSLASGRGSTTTSAVGGMSPVLAGGGVGSDEPVEQTLLLVRPVWILDQDAAACRICTRTFNTVRRKEYGNEVDRMSHMEEKGG
ncbi:hypothetical protein BGX28_010132 [Mortierella sp. GBA30]|nr:hypothetical protein BGX28_010132 [Mortierella sp. GBA30]